MIRMWASAAAILTAALTAAGPGVAAEASFFCTNDGNRYSVGDYACLPACHGAQQYARCDAGTDGADWTHVSNVCPVARLSTPQAAPEGFTAIEGFAAELLRSSVPANEPAILSRPDVMKAL